MLQQSIIASFVGCLIGYLAVQTGSIWTGMAYHAVHNAMAYMKGRWMAESDAIESWMWKIDGEPVMYSPWVMLPAALVAARVLFYFHQLPYRKTEEEALQESIESEPVKALAP